MKAEVFGERDLLTCGLKWGEGTCGQVLTTSSTEGMELQDGLSYHGSGSSTGAFCGNDSDGKTWWLLCLDNLEFVDTVFTYWAHAS